MEVKQRIQQLAASISEEVIGYRRYIHANPELSFEEYNTCKYVSDLLTSFGVKHEVGIAGTGVVALIEGKNPASKVVALRADMDALPIEEKNDVPYKSTNIGVMHACGHDVHTSSLLGTAKILSQITDQFEGTIKLIFQPGEEKFPGGASLMIKEGVLQNPAPANIIGQHVMALIPAGKVGFREGMYMASADEIYITVKGKGGHAAMPDKNVDPILIASHIIVALQQVISRNCDPRIPAVLSFGKITGMGATNVIPDEVNIEGTFRTLNEEWRAEAKKRIRKMAEGIAESMGATCEIDIKDGYPFLQNAPALAKRMKTAAVEFLGEENVVDLDLWMAAEDFAYYSQEIDACFYRLGIRNEERGITSGVHTPTFDIDEKALQTGTGLMAWLAVEELKA
ncbi:MAG: M20 metallopeptidase family protein [Cytophaga sp.]|uniref:M20 metallopeptidase family protein n=1 Tax=Cytophaga sp. TaxID=29535 RepID=UPI003F7E961E